MFASRAAHRGGSSLLRRRRERNGEDKKSSCRYHFSLITHYGICVSLVGYRRMEKIYAYCLDDNRWLFNGKNRDAVDSASSIFKYYVGRNDCRCMSTHHR